MKILVTGGAGFIGSHLCERLIEAGHEVTALDDLSTGKRTFLSQLEGHPKFTFVHGSGLDRSLLNEVMDDCKVVFHLAAVLGVKNTVENPLKVIEGNIDVTRNVLELAFPRKTKVIFSSTSEVYGKNEELPFHEDSNRVLGPATKDRWCYATAKALDEHLCFAYAGKGLPVTVLRYFNTYGPRAISTQYGGVVPKFITAALKGDPLTVYGDGSQTRCFTYIDDCVTGTVLSLNSSVEGQSINIGNDQSISINELAIKIKAMTGSDSPIIHIPYEEAYGRGYEDTPNRMPDLSKSAKLVKYSPSIGMEEGLQKTIEWYRSQ